MSLRRVPKIDRRAAPIPVIEVIAALADPVRLEMVRRLASLGGRAAARDLYDDIGKSTASHHFKVLRTAGLIAQERPQGGPTVALRLVDVDHEYGGLLSSIVAAAEAHRRTIQEPGDVTT